MNCTASDGGTMEERFGLRKRMLALSEGTPRPLSIGFFAQFVMRSNLSTLGEESVTGEELLKTLIVPARRRLCIGSGVG
jgi:hypothetical protein